MLPFLAKLKTVADSGTITRKPDEDKEQEDHGLKTCAQQLIDAIHNKDANMAAQALKDAFDVLESQPHEEYHDFDGSDYEDEQDTE